MLENYCLLSECNDVLPNIGSVATDVGFCTPFTQIVWSVYSKKLHFLQLDT